MLLILNNYRAIIDKIFG